MEEEILRHTSHRPYPLPAGPWVMQNSWDDLLFAHWPVSPELISAKIPKELSIDTWGGQAWIGVVPFKMRDVKFRLLPPIPTTRNFLELNVRTYVTYKGKSGVYFFSLDASSTLVAAGGRMGAGLNYYRADMETENREDAFFYRNKRIFSEAELKISYKPEGAIYLSEKGSIDEWLTERYCLFSQPFPGSIVEIGIHHHKWPLQKAVAGIESNSMTLPVGIELKGDPAYLHFARHLKVLIWPPSARKIF